MFHLATHMFILASDRYSSVQGLISDRPWMKTPDVELVTARFAYLNRRADSNTSCTRGSARRPARVPVDHSIRSAASAVMLRCHAMAHLIPGQESTSRNRQALQKVVTISEYDRLRLIAFSLQTDRLILQ